MLTRFSLVAQLFTDHTVHDFNVPKRIVSLVPSITELLFDLGLADDVVGITKFCIHPKAWVNQKTIVGGTKKIRKETILKLNPDLVIANKEENTKEDIEWLMANNIKVWVSDISTFSDMLAFIKDLGTLTGTPSKAEKLLAELEVEWGNLPKLKGKSVAYFIWKNPNMVAGRNTFIHEVLSILGLINVYGFKNRYPITDSDELKLLNPNFILLSSEPFPFKTENLDYFQKELPQAKVMLVDGEMFSWYGSRMLKAPAYFRSIFTNC